MAKWKVHITKIAGNRELLEGVFDEVGFSLDGDFLVSDKFEALDEPVEITKLLDSLRDRINRLSEADPDLDMRFQSGSIHQETADGVTARHSVTVAVGVGAITAAGQAVVVANGPKTGSEAERAEQELRRKVARASKILEADDEVLRALELLKGGPVDTYKAWEIIRDDLGRRRYKFAPEPEFKRFTGSLNHPDVSGQNARHERLKNPPPKNPMTEHEWRSFAKRLADHWIDNR